MINATRGSSNVHFSSESDEWETPQEFFDGLNEEFGFSLDPCATAENTKCERFYDKSSNGLAMSWEGEVVFMNPPYGREIGKWIRKAYGEINATVVCLVPARTDTTYWQKYCMLADEIRFVDGRLQFGDSENSAPFPSAVIVFLPGPRMPGPSVFSSDRYGKKI